VAEPQNRFLSSFHSSGILLVDKPEGPTSAQVVARVKAILKAKKVGHLGTLDPFASGLLPLGINEGTKIAQLFLTAQKSYAGRITLGVETDTQDPTGKVLEVRRVPPLDEKRTRELEQAFTGALSQTPPMFSALKKEGVRLYRLARQGQNVDRLPRQIQVEQLRLWILSAAELGFEVTCSKGTYVRALAADMGTFLGCGAHLKSLRRLSCGHFTLDQAVSVADIEAMNERGNVPLISLSQALEHLRPFHRQDSLLSRLRKGQQEELADLGLPREASTESNAYWSLDSGT
jgi:tRNA pseudouridine55 synthase